MRKLASFLLLVSAGLLLLALTSLSWWHQRQRHVEGRVGLTSVKSCPEHGSCTSGALVTTFRRDTSRWRAIGELTSALCVIGIAVLAAIALLVFVRSRGKSAIVRSDRGFGLVVIIHACAVMLFSIAFVAHAPKVLQENASLGWGWPTTWLAGILAIAAGTLLYRVSAAAPVDDGDRHDEPVTPTAL